MWYTSCLTSYRTTRKILNLGGDVPCLPPKNYTLAIAAKKYAEVDIKALQFVAI